MQIEFPKIEQYETFFMVVCAVWAALATLNRQWWALAFSCAAGVASLNISAFFVQ